MSTQEITPYRMENSAMVRPEDFMPVVQIDGLLKRKAAMGQIITQVLVEGSDFGVIPGTKFPTLLKPGAEKLATCFGLTPKFIPDVAIEDWHGSNSPNGEALFYYRIKCQLWRGDRLWGEADGSCSSWESKYRYRWVAENDLPPGLNKANLLHRGGARKFTETEYFIGKAEINPKYGKTEAYWQAFRDAIEAGTAKKTRKTISGTERDAYEISIDENQFRIPNPDIADQVNTVLKMAEKRALVAAVLIATNASDSFTQDMEDYSTSNGEVIDTGGHKPGTQAAQDHVRDSKLADAKRAQPNTGNGKAEELPQVIQQLYTFMGTSKKGILTAFAELKKDALEVTGSNDLYYSILLKHGMNHANDDVTLAKHRMVAREIFEAKDAWADDGREAAAAAGYDHNEEFRKL